MYTKLDFNKRFFNKVTELIGPIFKIGYDGKLISKDPCGTLETPWVFINHDARKKFCNIWNGVYCIKFNLIPTHCRINCWKTVVKIPTVKDLYQCYEIFKQMDLPSKLGIDRRDYTTTPYAGFIYGDSLEQGRKYYKIARANIPEHIPIILKRGCTEMERLKPSDKWDEITVEDLHTEDRLNDIFRFEEKNFAMASWVKKSVKEKWITHAIMIGDPTAKETAEKYSDDPDIWNKLVVHSVTYHEEGK